MDFNFCNGCDESISCMPECMVISIVNKISIEDFLYKLSDTVEVMYPLCTRNAQSFENNTLKINSKCDQCGLCMFACEKNTQDFILNEKKVLSELPITNFVLRKLTNCPVASEVKVAGNYRNKRIDLVIKKNKDVVFIKVLKTVDKLNFYMRSYDEVVNFCNNNFPNYKFKRIALIPKSELNDSLIGTCISMSDIRTIFEGEL